VECGDNGRPLAKAYPQDLLAATIRPRRPEGRKPPRAAERRAAAGAQGLDPRPVGENDHAVEFAEGRRLVQGLQHGGEVALPRNRMAAAP
jgi:hypothetical protein